MRELTEAELEMVSGGIVNDVPINADGHYVLSGAEDETIVVTGYRSTGGSLVSGLGGQGGVGLSALLSQMSTLNSGALDNGIHEQFDRHVLYQSPMDDFFDNQIEDNRKTADG